MSLDFDTTTIKKSIEPYVRQVRNTINSLTKTNLDALQTLTPRSAPTVTVEIESGKHTVRVNGVLIESFWREKAATTLADRIRSALSV